MLYYNAFEGIDGEKFEDRKRHTTLCQNIVV